MKYLLQSLLRALLRVVVLIVVLGAGLLVIIHNQLPSYERPKATVAGLGAPALPAGFKIEEGDIKQKEGHVLVMVSWDYKAVSNDKAIDVYLALYKWGNDLLDHGEVDVILAIPGKEPILTVDGRVRFFYVIFEASLEQTQIDRLLRQPPIDMEHLLTFLADVAKATKEAGARLFTPDAPVPYTGLHTYYDQAK